MCKKPYNIQQLIFNKHLNKASIAYSLLLSKLILFNLRVCVFTGFCFKLVLANTILNRIINI